MQWINVKERLPLVDDWVMAFGMSIMDDKPNVYAVRTHDFHGKMGFVPLGYEDDGELRSVTHWCEYPEPPAQ